MNRRKFLKLVGGSSIIALAGCTETENNTNPEDTNNTNENRFQDTDEDIEYPPGLSANNIDMNEFMENTPLLDSSSKPNSVEYTSEEIVTRKGEIASEKIIKGWISIPDSAFRKRKSSTNYTEVYKTQNEAHEAEFDGNTLRSVNSVDNSFDKLDDSGYYRVGSLVSKFDVESHSVKKDTVTGRLVHVYTSTDSSMDVSVAELEVGFYENGIVSYIKVYNKIESPAEYNFEMYFNSYGETEATKPEWHPDKKGSSADITRDEIPSKD